jgi:ABC-type sugar transport system substrate-binding protein
MYPVNDRRYVMNVAISQMAFWNEPRHTWEKIGSVIPGLEMLFGGPANDDVSKQIEELEMLISQDVSGLVVFANDAEAVKPTINKAVDKGIPVITAFADVRGSKRLAHIGTNQEILGRAIAQQVMHDRKDKFKRTPRALVAIGRETSQDQIERLEGIRSVISGYMELVDPVEDSFNKDEAERVIRNAFESYGEIDFIFGCNSQSAIGAVNALKKLQKKPGDVVVTGWDTETEVMNHIKGERGGRGWIQATAVLYASYMVQACFAMLEAANFGYLYSDTLNTQELRLPAVPDTLQIPMKEVVTSKNVDEYLGKL